MHFRGSFTSWVRENAVSFDPLDGARADIGRLAILDDAVARSRIVFLGEQGHFIHEKGDYRLWFLRYLFTRGFRTLAEELSWSDGLHIDRYIETGDAAELERITTYGYRGAWRQDRDDRPTGYLRESWDAYPEEIFAAEQLRLTRALRSLSEGRDDGERFRFFGFDVDAVPGGAYEQLEAALAPLGAEPEIRELRACLARVPGETLEEEIARLDRALVAMRAGEPRLRRLLPQPGPGFDLLHRSALTLRESFAYMRLAHAAPTLDALGPAMQHRELLMHGHLAHIIERLGPDEKLILMGANDHLCRDVDGIRRHTAGVPAGGGKVPPIGTFVARRHPGEVFSIWLLYERGRDSQPFVSLGNDLHSPRRSLNRRLGRAGDAFVITTASNDPRSALLRREAQIVSMYNTTYRARPSDQVDAICFIRDVSPLRV